MHEEKYEDCPHRKLIHDDMDDLLDFALDKNVNQVLFRIELAPENGAEPYRILEETISMASLRRGMQRGRKPR